MFYLFKLKYVLSQFLAKCDYNHKLMLFLFLDLCYKFSLLKTKI